MGYELDKLMRSLGVSTTSALPYASDIKAPKRPAEGASAEDIRAYNDQMAQYLADRNAYQDYKEEYQRRVSSGSPYTQEQYQPTRRLEAQPSTPLAARDVPWTENPVQLQAREPINYVTSQAPTYGSQLRAPSYGTPAPLSEGLSDIQEASGSKASEPYYIAIQRYLQNHTAAEAKQYFGASDYDIQMAKKYISPSNEWDKGFAGPHQIQVSPEIANALYYGGNPRPILPPSTPGELLNATLAATRPDLSGGALNSISLQQGRNALVQAGIPYGRLPGSEIHGPQEIANRLQTPITNSGTTYMPSAPAEGQSTVQIPNAPLTIDQAKAFLTNANIPFGQQEGAVARGAQQIADYLRTPIVRGDTTFTPGAQPARPAAPVLPSSQPARRVAPARPAAPSPGLPTGPLGQMNPFNLSPDVLAGLRQRFGLKFAQGGPVKMQGGGMMDIPEYIRAQEAPETNAYDDLRSKYEAYQSMLGPTPYAEEIATARKEAKDQQEAFLKSLQGAMGDSGASKAEMYFRLAAALGQPTRSGTLGETIGNVGQAMAESAKAGRERQMAQRQLGLEAQKIRAGMAKEELGALQDLAESEQKGRREFVGKVLEAELAGGKPMSDIGKQARDAGLTPGTPDYQKFVKDAVDRKAENEMLRAQGVSAGLDAATARLELAQKAQALQEAKAEREAKKLDPQSQKTLQDTDELLTNIDTTLGALQEAYKKNVNTYGGTWTDTFSKFKAKAINEDDPKYLATLDVNNLLTQAAAPNVKAIFAGNPSERESMTALGLSGAGEMNQKQRDNAIRATVKMLLKKQEQLKKRREQIASGAYQVKQSVGISDEE